MSEYDIRGLVITTIDVRDIGNNQVEFDGRIVGDVNDDSVAYLKNVKLYEWKELEGSRYPVFRAENIATEELKAYTDALRLVDGDRKDLFTIHGFTVEPEDHLRDCKAVQDRFKKFRLVPIIWPSDLDYKGCKDISSGAGRALSSVFSQLSSDMFPGASLTAHSMGNRVLGHAATDNSNIKFDNIFMVAADTYACIFDKEYIVKPVEESGTERDISGEHYYDHAEWDDGLKIASMLSPNGKIHVLHNQNDYALAGSWAARKFKGWTIGKERLGSGGACLDSLHKDLEGKVINFDAGASWLNWTSSFAAHSYKWDQQAIAYYESQA